MRVRENDEITHFHLLCNQPNYTMIHLCQNCIFIENGDFIFIEVPISYIEEIISQAVSD
jgi:hypothetical protein